jgi:hypothetical protein
MLYACTCLLGTHSVNILGHIHLSDGSYLGVTRAVNVVGAIHESPLLFSPDSSIATTDETFEANCDTVVVGVPSSPQSCIAHSAPL